MDTTQLNLIRDLLNVDEIPVSFREFVSGKDYCNNPDLYEYWYNEDAKVPPTCSELILDGSLGSGKSTYAAYKVGYYVYRLFFNGSPQKQLNLPENADIYGMYFSVSMTQAKRSGFQYLYNLFETCGWFNKYCPINKNLKSSIEFIGRHFSIIYASDEGHQIGLNVNLFILDEANFKGAGVGNGTEEQYEAVTQLYEQLIDRQLSRFSRPDGGVNALAVLISSASYQSSFVERRKLATRGSKYTHVITSRAYEVKPHLFSKDKFEVFIGAGAVPAEVVRDEDHKKFLIKQANIPEINISEYFIQIPENLRPSFEQHPVLALQNHAGIPVNASSSFMSNMTYLYASYVPGYQPPIPEYLEASNADDTELIEYLNPELLVYPERPHSLFLDLSVQTDTGALCCYRYDGEFANGHRHTRVFSIHIVPPHFPHQTQISKVQRFIIALGQYINIVAFGSDQYQSTQVRQEVQLALAIEDIRISIDSSDVPHLLWLRGLYEGRISQAKDEYLEREVKEAVHDIQKHRVLKAKNSSDDILQANVGAYYLSETIASSEGILPKGQPINIVGTNAFQTFMRKAGYRTI